MSRELSGTGSVCTQLSKVLKWVFSFPESNKACFKTPMACFGC